MHMCIQLQLWTLATRIPSSSPLTSSVTTINTVFRHCPTPQSLVEELWVGVCHALKMKTSMQKQSQSDWDRTLEDKRKEREVL